MCPTAWGTAWAASGWSATSPWWTGDLQDRLFFLLFSTVVVLFVVLSSTYFIRSIVTPIGRWGSSPPRSPRGDFSVRLKTQHNDEIGQLCNIINYMEEYDKTFQTSAFWHKCNTMLLMSYEHFENKPKGDFRIDEAVLFSFPEEDLAIIEHDWETIMSKVRAGRAHELSEAIRSILPPAPREPMHPVCASSRSPRFRQSSVRIP